MACKYIDSSKPESFKKGIRHSDKWVLMNLSRLIYVGDQWGRALGTKSFSSKPFPQIFNL